MKLTLIDVFLLHKKRGCDDEVQPLFSHTSGLKVNSIIATSYRHSTNSTPLVLIQSPNVKGLETGLKQLLGNVAIIQSCLKVLELNNLSLLEKNYNVRQSKK